MPNLWIVFTTGLLTGGLTCMAAQGGLLATLVAQRRAESEERSEKYQILLFLGSKLVAYTALGALLGWLGSFFQLSLGLQAILMATVAIFMIGSALALLDVHPFFRHFLITPPRFLMRLIRNQSKSQDYFAPALLGAMTIFVPCGTTQAMMALAIASANPFLGAAILATFVLGTSPLFFTIGYGASRLGGIFRDQFRNVVAGIVLGIAIWNLNVAAMLSGSRFNLRAFASAADCVVFANCGATGGMIAGAAASEATIRIQSNGYTVDRSVLKAGSTVTLRLVNESGKGCTQAFTIPSLGIQQVVPLGQNRTLVFKVPDEPGKLPFTCSMGMFGGEFQISS